MTVAKETLCSGQGAAVAASGRGRAFLVERHLEADGNAALQALIADYRQQAHRHDQIPMLVYPLS